jgi:hypothetical protein
MRFKNEFHGGNTTRRELFIEHRSGGRGRHILNVSAYGLDVSPNAWATRPAGMLAAMEEVAAKLIDARVVGDDSGCKLNTKASDAATALSMLANALADYRTWAQTVDPAWVRWLERMEATK